MAVAGGAMTAMLALSAGPVMANEVEFSDDVDFSNNDHMSEWAYWIEEVEYDDGELDIELVDGSDLDVEDTDLDTDDSDTDSDSDFDGDSVFDGGSSNTVSFNSGGDRGGQNHGGNDNNGGKGGNGGRN